MSESFSKLHWDTIEKHISNESGHSFSSYVDRCRVPGGWLVRSYAYLGHWNERSQSAGVGGGITFVPDPEGNWEL